MSRMSNPDLDPNLALEAYDYDLPQEHIALFPARQRTEARLMVIPRVPGEIQHRHFHDIKDFLVPGDVLILNDTRVIPARLWGTKPETGGQVQVLLLKLIQETLWEVLLQPSGRVSSGQTLVFEKDGTRLEAVVKDPPREGSGMRQLEFKDSRSREKIRILGHMPLPPYLGREDEASDRQDYQTVFARQEGAVAAPTAGLHFDEPLLDLLRERGTEIQFITLHTGYGTFQPVEAEDIRSHRMFEETFTVSEAAASSVNRAKAQGRRVIACGTTAVRALESAAEGPGQLRAISGETGLFIYPPYDFKIIDGLITNFHLPKSTLLMMVSAFLGRERLFEAYRDALNQQYRFYSYGDAMLIL